MTKDEESRVYYHALYHLIAHWAAYIATLGFFVTLISNNCLSNNAPNIDHPSVFLMAVGFTFAASLYFLWRIHAYMIIVNDLLPHKYIKDLERCILVGPWMTWVGAVVSIVLAALCCWIVHMPFLVTTVSIVMVVLFCCFIHTARESK